MAHLRTTFISPGIKRVRTVISIDRIKKYRLEFVVPSIVRIVDGFE